METTKHIAGRYALEERLGQGGMGEVWLATDTVLKRKIALKEVRVPDSLAGGVEQQVDERVLREARAAARLTHPAVTAVYDVFEEDGRTFIAMELVDAPTLAELVREHGALTPRETARVGLELLDALDAAHATGMVHRDVKPDNVMIQDTGQVKLTDFGIASVKGDPKLTMSGVILGSPSYMAPEQAEGSAADREADLWALGATLYFALEARPPFGKNSPIATLASVVNDPVPEPSNAGELRDTLMRLLSKDPSARPGPESVRRELTLVAEGRSPLPGRTSTTTIPVTPAAPEPKVVPAPRAPARRSGTGARSRGTLLMAGLVVLALIAGVTAALIGRGDESPSTTSDGAPEGRQGAGGGAEPQEPAGDWVTHAIADTGYQISYPQGWEVFESGSQTTFSDPESSTSMLVEYTTSPGTDAVAAWEAQAASFAADHEGYNEITIEETQFDGFDTAANWEFTWIEDGFELHGLDIGLANEDIGFALFFTTAASDWEAEQDTLDAFKDSFGTAS